MRSSQDEAVNVVGRGRGAACILGASLVTIAVSSTILGLSWRMFASGEQWTGFVLGWWIFGMLPAVLIGALSIVWWVATSRRQPTLARLMMILIIDAGMTLAVLGVAGAFAAGMLG